MDIGHNNNKFLTTLSVCAGIIPLLTFLTSYIAALKLGHLRDHDGVPFIRDLAAHQPESTIFSLGLCIAYLMHITLVYARYVQVLAFRHPPCPKSNDASCYFGPLLVFGESIISSFRDFRNQWAFYFGKTIFFASFCIYIGIQSYIGIHTPAYHRKFLVYSRCFLTAISSVCPFLSIFGMSFGNLKQLGVPQVAELTLLIITSLFWVTLAVDFKDNNVVYLFRYYEIQAFSVKRRDYDLKILTQHKTDGSKENNDTKNEYSNSIEETQI